MDAKAIERRQIEQALIRPFQQVGRIVTPSATAWTALETTLTALVEEDGRDPRTVKRSFLFDVLIAYSCREAGAALISRNRSDLERIARIVRFEYTAPFPELGS